MRYYPPTLLKPLGEWNLPLNYILCILPLRQWLVLEMSHHANISTAIGKEWKQIHTPPSVS